MSQTHSGVGSQGPKVFYERQSLIRTLTRLAFSFPTNGSASPTKIRGDGVTSVVWVSTGLFTVTLKDYWAKVHAAKVQLALAAPAATKAQLVGLSSNKALASALTFQIQILGTDSGSAADVAAATGNDVNVLLLLGNSSFGAA